MIIKERIRILCITALVFCLCQEIYGQYKYSREYREKKNEADDYFRYENYSVALPVFLELSEMDSMNTEVSFKTGVSIYMCKRDKSEAVKYFEKAKNDFADSYYYLGNLYHRAQLFDRALSCFNYYKCSPEKGAFSDREVDHCMDKSYDAKLFISRKTNVAVQNMGAVINSSYPDYVPLITSDETVMMFTSRREGSTGGMKDPNGEYFEDIYISRKKDGEWSPPENLGSPVNTLTHDACISLTSDGQKMFVYRTNKELTGGDIYLSNLKDGKWSEPEKLNGDINTPGGIESSASLAPNEQVLYFSSNRPGGYGGRDLYIVRKLPDGEWGLAQNMGPVINTPYDEDSPFIHPDGTTLFFSSKGHRNIGGYDIFKSVYEGGMWSAPVNLGYPINTVDDDIYFVVSANGKRGYYSSDRDGGEGHSDIYSIDMPDIKLNRILLKGTVTTHDPVFSTLHATITIIDYQTKELHGIYRTNRSTGKYLMVLLPKKKYKIIVESDGYHSYVGEIDMTKRLRMEDLFKDISLEKESKEEDRLKMLDDKEE